MHLILLYMCVGSEKDSERIGLKGQIKEMIKGKTRKEAVLRFISILCQVHRAKIKAKLPRFMNIEPQRPASEVEGALLQGLFMYYSTHNPAMVALVNRTLWRSF